MRHRAAAATALAFAPVAALAVAGWARRWTSEDAYIYYRVVDNVLTGNGLVFNLGERVEAYTGPLWLGLLALGRAVLPGAAAIEWISVGLGLALGLAGLTAGIAGARTLWSDGGGPGPRPVIALPLGALVVVALPPFWDYATSGLETGLTFAWLGGCFLGLVSLRGVRRSASEGRRLDGRGPLLLAAAIGLGPLVRPEIAVIAAVFVVLLVVTDPVRSARRVAGLVAAAAAPPLAYQVFRMGYFGALVPNTAPAKEAATAFWARGFAYLGNLLGPYTLWLPLVPLVAFAGWRTQERWRLGDRSRAWLIAGPLGAGALHAVYVVRVGGDYMHARLLLPALFTLLLPVMVVPARPRLVAAGLAAVVAPWAVVCALVLRAPAEPPKDRGELQVHDQRRRYVEVWRYRDPVAVSDLRLQPERRIALQARQGIQLRELAEQRRAIVLRFGGPRNRFGERERLPEAVPDVVPRPDLPSRVVVWHGSAGRVAFAAGPLVHLADPNGLGDALAARTRLSRPRTWYPGHEKHLPAPWVLARYGVAANAAGAARLDRDPEVQAARRALACPPLRELVAATTAPLTVRRFVANMGYAVRGYGLRVSRDPVAAAGELCGRRSTAVARRSPPQARPTPGSTR